MHSFILIGIVVVLRGEEEKGVKKNKEGRRRSEEAAIRLRFQAVLRIRLHENSKKCWDFGDF